MQRFHDPARMPGTDWTPAELLEHALPLRGTPGQDYVARRGVDLATAEAADLRFAPDFGGRPAVLAALRDEQQRLTAVHGRHLNATHAQNKMRTIGTPGGVISVRGGWRADPFLIVEGLFDALSLASAGWAAIATIGRDADWLAEVSSGRSVWLACDAGRPGEAEAARLAARLPRAHTRRLPPPPRCKDWNTALGKLGPARISQWIAAHVELAEHAS